MASNYWNSILQGRISRRHALAATGALAGGAAFLAACGGGSSDKGKQTGSSLITVPVDTSKQAKRGGVLKGSAIGDVSNFDPALSSNPLNRILEPVVGALFQFKPGYMAPSTFEVQGYMAESWETSPDGMTITLKIRPGVNWHNKTPVNGRAMDVEDLVFSWNRFAAKGGTRSTMVNSVNPNAPILSFTATDSKTVVIKQKEPVAFTPALFATWNSGEMLVMPKETDSTLDPKTQLVGTGPFMLANYTPSVGFTLERNPTYFEKDYPFIDKQELPIITDYSVALTQMKSGGIYNYLSSAFSQIKPDDVITLKREQPNLDIVQEDFAASSLGQFAFGYSSNKPLFTDERIRQALSMSLDRDLFIETFGSVAQFEAAGLPVEKRWNSVLSAGFKESGDYWLDPQGKDFGPNAAFYQHDPAGAKKLLSAAGWKNDTEIPFYGLSGNELGPAIPKTIEVIIGMAATADIKIKLVPINYITEYIPRYRDGRGQFEGITYKTSGGAPAPVPINLMLNNFWSKSGVQFYGFDAAGKGDSSGDPQLDSMIEKARLEKDANQSRTQVKELQRYLAKKMYGLPVVGSSTTFYTGWPALSNYYVYRDPPSVNQFIWNKYAWIDQTKPPFSKA